LMVLICGGVVVTNEHWVSDVIAGAFLGASIGRMTVLMLGSHMQLASAGIRRSQSSSPTLTVREGPVIVACSKHTDG
jgi:hypothetical protein